MFLKDTDQTVVDEAVHLLSRNIKYGITVAQVAERLAISEKSLQRSFQRIHKMGVYAYFKKWKMEQAQLLLMSGRSVKQAGLSCGYKNDSAFVQAFKDVLGIPPGEWQRKQAS